MPYQGGERLPAERASRLSHLAVLQSELVNKLCRSFETPAAVPLASAPTWEPVPCTKHRPLPLIFGVDGSVQVITGDPPLHKTMAFVKTALLRLDTVALKGLDKESPNPFALRDILADSALYHATVFPLRHVVVPGLSIYDAVRQVIFESLRDASLSGEPFETLKWLAYEKWDGTKETLRRCLFVKDGPLSLRAQYSKLVAPIRRFLMFARNQGYPICILGQEKSGRFYDHLQLIAQDVPVLSVFLPNDSYIKQEIQYRPDTGQPYGLDTNYGAKLFVRLNEHHHMVVNIPTGEFRPNPNLSELIGVNRIFATLPTILSSRHEGALLPVELAHGVASLSTYPSAHILKVFADTVGGG